MSGRGNRFVQTSQNGITVYSREQVFALNVQYNQNRMDFNNILLLLKADLAANNNNFKKFWNDADKVYRAGAGKYKAVLKMQNGGDFPDECHIAIICYTMGNQISSMYGPFNSDCRQACSNGGNSFGSIGNRSMFHLLYYVMENRAGSPKSAEPAYFYRGYDKGAFVPLQKDQIIGFGHFTSTSEVNSVAVGFAAGVGSHTVVRIRNTGSNTITHIKMENHSVIPNEKEYLLSPFQLYKVVSTLQNGNLTEINVDIC